MRTLYNIGMYCYRLGVAAVSPWHKKARLWRDGRKQLFNRMRASIDSSAPIVWVHVASLGEFEQGRPIIEKIKAERPEYKILLTFFSPSGYEIRKNYQGADYIFYLPIDTQSNAREFLDIVKPQIAVFVKYEYWINLLSELKVRNIPTYIVSAIFRRDSIFFRSTGNMWREALKSFNTLFVQDENSKALLAELGHDNVVVAGDTRFDRVAQIAAAAKKIELIEQFKGDSRLFVAGSSWGPDEDLIVRLANENPTIKFIVAPHEMEQTRMAKIEQTATGGAVRYTKVEGDIADKQILILDTIGMLSSVYGYADFSYIGGGFGVGIHNTLEAATFGLPIAFGPNYHKFKEARDMIALGGATSVSNYEELSAWFAPLRDDEQHLKRVSQISKDYTTKNQGATDIFFEKVFGTKK
ncbi:MAG: 3-deoxy-D-manno-octulosonic acid transferase [Alistipes sp.]|nr:3-deoxy-D-manno-octulosonic acid transferase [Alistipes sp.]